MDLTNNFFVVFMDKEDHQLQSHAAAPVQIVLLSVKLAM